MEKLKIRISLFAYMMDKLARNGKLSFTANGQEFEIVFADFKIDIISWTDISGTPIQDINAVYKKPSEMN